MSDFQQTPMRPNDKQENVFFGCASAEVLDRNCQFLQAVNSHQSGLAAIRTAISSQSNGYAKLRNHRKDVSLSVNGLFTSPFKDAQGVVTHFVGIPHSQTQSIA